MTTLTLEAVKEMRNQTIPWLRLLAAEGGKGVVNNIDARSLGRIADHLSALLAERALEQQPSPNAEGRKEQS